MASENKLSVICISFMLIALALWILWPGVHGNFYLDDFVNLGGLERIDGSWLAYLSYLLEAPVGGSGRPISYVTFLLQADSWPNSPFDFKLVNLSVHVFNGFLVGGLTYLVGSKALSASLDTKALIISAVIAGFLWLILPINMSSVFYVVQRMTLLSATMMLVSLVGFAYLRCRFPTWGKGQYLAGTLIVGFGYLGVFAKETAILTGVLVWVLEYSVFSRTEKPLSKAWKLFVLLLPLFSVGLYLWLSGKVLGGYETRDFSLSERLLSQSLIIFDYFGKIILPTNGRINLYNDGFPFATLIENQFLVAVALIMLFAAAVAGFRVRSSLLALGILFFFAGHLLESTFIPLELYFEHRNYLPSVGVVVAVVLALSRLMVRIRHSSKILGLVFLLSTTLWGGWLSTVSAVEARTWGDPRAFAIASLTERPNSLRARQEMAAYFVAAGDYLGAANLLYSIDEDFGVFSGTYAQLLMLQCFRSDVPLPNKSELQRIFATAAFDFGTTVALQDIWTIKRSSNKSCSAVTDEQLLDVLDALISNPAFRNRNNLYVLKAFVLADQGGWAAASDILRNIPPERASVPELILAARFDYYAGETEGALDGLREAKDRIKSPFQDAVYGQYIRKLESQFKIEAAPLKKGATDL